LHPTPHLISTAYRCNTRHKDDKVPLCVNPVYTTQTQPVVKPVFNRFHNRFDNRLDNLLYRVYKHSTACPTRYDAVGVYLRAPKSRWTASLIYRTDANKKWTN